MLDLRQYELLQSITISFTRVVRVAKLVGVNPAKISFYDFRFLIEARTFQSPADSGYVLGNRHPKLCCISDADVGIRVKRVH